MLAWMRPRYGCRFGDYCSVADYNLKLLLFKRIELYGYIVSVNFVVCEECSCYLSSHCTW